MCVCVDLVEQKSRTSERNRMELWISRCPASNYGSIERSGVDLQDLSHMFYLQDM